MSADTTPAETPSANGSDASMKPPEPETDTVPFDASPAEIVPDEDDDYAEPAVTGRTTSRATRRARAIAAPSPSTRTTMITVRALS